MIKIFTIILPVLFFTMISNSYAQFDYTKVTPELAHKLSNNSESEILRIFVNMKDKVDIESLDAMMYQNSIPASDRGKIVIEALQQKATTTQQQLLGHLNVLRASGSVLAFDSYWISNSVWIETDIRTIKYLSYRSDIELIEIDYPIEFEEGFDLKISDSPESIETGLRVVKADKLWRLGITGQGMIVMNIDSGVDGNHPALNHKWKGNSTPWYHAWMDAQGSSAPSWCSNHGTHTIGTICGRSITTTDTIGVAPDAIWMAAKRSCSGNYSSFAITAMQWAVDPDSNPNTNDAPIVINCSWNTTDPSGNQCEGTYKNTLLALEAAGIAVVWSAGNSGPGASTVTSPKNINANIVNAFTVGALDGNNQSYPIANFSSRGPSVCGGQGSLLIKPEVSAPGVNVRSAVLSNQYGTLSGTSMAAPHVSGVVALLKSFAPNLTSRQILEGIYFSCIDLGTPGEDNTYGMGLIDAVAAMSKLGLQIFHTPLSDTTPSAFYRVSADITPSEITGAPVKPSNMKVMWGTNGNISDSLQMQQGSGNQWYADIPNVGATSYAYYIKVYDTLDVRAQSPVEAPFEIYTFNTGITFVSSTSEEAPHSFALHQNYPNPFNPETQIRFDLPKDNFVSMKVFDVSGREVMTLINESLAGGSYVVNFNASGIGSGVYFYTISAGEFRDTKRFIVLK